MMNCFLLIRSSITRLYASRIAILFAMASGGSDGWMTNSPTSFSISLSYSTSYSPRNCRNPASFVWKPPASPSMDEEEEDEEEEEVEEDEEEEVEVDDDVVFDREEEEEEEEEEDASGGCRAESPCASVAGVAGVRASLWSRMLRSMSCCARELAKTLSGSDGVEESVVWRSAG